MYAINVIKRAGFNFLFINLNADIYDIDQVMKFCDICESRMVKSTATGRIIFICGCGNPVDGTPDDTLIYSRQTTMSHSNLKHEVGIENAPFDNARYIIETPCGSCSLPYITSIRVGVQEQVLYVCGCGFKATYQEYTDLMNSRAQVE